MDTQEHREGATSPNVPNGGVKEKTHRLERTSQRVRLHLGVGRS